MMQQKVIKHEQMLKIMDLVCV